MEVVLHESSKDISCGTQNISDERKKVDSKINDEKYIEAENGSLKFVEIKFENVTFTAAQPTAQGNLPSFLRKKENKQILKSVNGIFPPGQLIAIMGPSGAGKSTLLDVLSGYKIHGIGGEVYVNGSPRNMKEFRKMSCYITQDDRLQPLLTVAENMLIAADLKLPTHISKRKKDNIINQILEKLGLHNHINTRISQLSGGQKKRMSIALELISNPTIMFLDEPTTGLDSSSCLSCMKLLKKLVEDGVSIICTIHQPSASLLALFDQVYILAVGRCLYQGATDRLLDSLEAVGSPCPKFHNPADYVIELASGEYGSEIIEKMVTNADNGRCISYMKDSVVSNNTQQNPNTLNGTNLLITSKMNQLKVLLRREFIKSKRDTTLTYLRLGVNFLVSLMLGILYWRSGVDGSKALNNFNLLFSILMHHMMSTMMLTILTFPTEMSILIKEHFNRWYSLKMYFVAITLIDIPLSVCCSFIFSSVIYLMTAQPLEYYRFFMFFVTSTLVVFVAQSFGLMVGAYFNITNGTFMGPTLSVPTMMFAGFGVRLADLPMFFYWLSYLSYLRFGLEGLVGSVYGLGRGTMECPIAYCHYRHPKKLLDEIGISADQFDNDVVILLFFVFILRICAFLMLKSKLKSLR